MSAAVSRLLLFHLTSSSSSFLLRASERCRPGSSSFFYSSHRRALLSISILRSRSRPYATDAAAVVDVESSAPPPPVSSSSHPWPEWEHFLDKLRRKGYFELSTSSARSTEDGDGDGGGSSGGVSASGEPHYVSMEVNRIKNAALKFARERFDILRSLPKEDIQAIVACGCPNLFRKPVNSAKRLRTYLRLDEGDVCGSCYKRGSCDKAYIVPKEDEGARTVDVVRILMSYAINPEILSGRENSSIDKLFHESARKLLSELIKLSDTAIDPSLAKSTVVSSSKKEHSQKVSVKDKPPSNVEMKRGDWLCPNCNFLNFARNLRCLECKEDGPKRVNFEKTEMKLGDWTCPKCEFMNFARNKKCFRCEGPRPKRELNPGEWECLSCNYVNFRKNMVCKKCNCDRPEDEGENHLWKKPVKSARNNTVEFGDDEDEVDDDDVLPELGENKFVVSKRATIPERRLTAARKRNYS